MSGEISIVYFTDKSCLHRPYKKIPGPSVHNCRKKKKSGRSKMPYMISSQSVTDGVSLSISKLKLVYNSLIFVDDKLTLVCLLT